MPAVVAAERGTSSARFSLKVILRSQDQTRRALESDVSDHVMTAEELYWLKHQLTQVWVCVFSRRQTLAVLKVIK